MTDHPDNTTWRDAVTQHVTTAARHLGADPEKLLDSRRFLATLDDLVDADPNAPAFRDAIATKVRAAVGPRVDPIRNAYAQRQQRNRELIARLVQQANNDGPTAA